MKRVRAHDKDSGKLVKTLHAASITEGARYAYDYRCLNEACSCTLHWRRAVQPHENTEYRAETFVKNPSSAHIQGCRYDFVSFVNEHSDIASTDGDTLNLRLLFPIGGAPADRFVERPGMLSQRQRERAQGEMEKRGLPSLRELVNFLEKHFKGLEDPGLEDLKLHYQGEEIAWPDIYVASDKYRKLIDASGKRDERERTMPVFAVVKPANEIAPNRYGKRRFVCEAQYAKPGYKLLTIKPILVCESAFMAEGIEKVIAKAGTMLVSARPMVAPDRHSSRDLPVYLYCWEVRQLSQVKNDYWRIVSGPRHQTDFLEELEDSVQRGPGKKIREPEPA